MRVRGDNAPSGALSVEPHPQKPGIAIVRLFENPEPFEEKQGELTLKGWEYDEYHLELPLYDTLALDVAAAYDGYLAQAKAEEEEAKDPEASLLELKAAQSDTDEMAVDQEYRITMLELGVSDTDDTDNTDNT